MRNLKIRQKFLLLGFTILLSLIFIAWLSLKINSDSFKNLNSVFGDFRDTHKIQTLYIEDLYTLREMGLSSLITIDEKRRKKIDNDILIFAQRLDKNFSKGFGADYSYWKKYRESIYKTRELLLSGKRAEAFVNSSTTSRGYFYALVNNLKQLQNKKLKDSQTKLKSLKKGVENNNTYILFSIFFIGAIGLLLDITVILKLVKDIDRVKNGLNKFFDYLNNPINYKESLKIEVSSCDELGLMSEAINQNIELIKENLNEDYELIKEATTTLDRLKQGCFGSRIEKEGKSIRLNTLKNVMNEAIESLESKIQDEIDQRTKQEKLMLQQSKLAAMGEMIGNIAHQWRQPLGEINAILMELETITKYGKLEKELLLQSIKSCNCITEHMSSTINDFQNFFIPSKQKDDFSVLVACKKALSIISASLKNNNIALNFDVQEDNIINGYENEFSHAILNIISNAKDVLILRKIKNPKITISIKVGKKYTVIKILDNAGGIRLPDINRIFEPYFTTKHAKQGTGIGLYMTKIIIEESMQGFVTAKNSRDGALFKIKVM